MPIKPIKITIFKENRSDSGLLEDLELAVSLDKDLLLDADGDLLIVLGDRPAALRAALSFVERHKPVTHISGGEQTGNIDDYIRHAITKLSHLHFTSTELYRDRVISLGENPDTVFWVGEPGLDKIELKTYEPNGYYLITYHPTFDDSKIDELFIAFERLLNLQDVQLIFTAPNTDTGWELILKKILDFRDNHNTAIDHDRVVFHYSLGRSMYLKTLKHAIAVIGNSSSGLVEAPQFGIPCVNIGSRQNGRVRGENVTDCVLDAGFILDAIKNIKRPPGSFGYFNPYYKDGKAIPAIIDAIKNANLTELIRKPGIYGY